MNIWDSWGRERRGGSLTTPSGVSARFSCSPKLSISLSRRGLHDSESSATIQNNLFMCIKVWPSLVSSAICSRLWKMIKTMSLVIVLSRVSYTIALVETANLYEPGISWCHKIYNWKLPVMTRRLCCRGGG